MLILSGSVCLENKISLSHVFRRETNWKEMLTYGINQQLQHNSKAKFGTSERA